MSRKVIVYLGTIYKEIDVMKKRIYLLIMTICSLSILASCGKNQETTEEAEAPVVEEIIEEVKEEPSSQENDSEMDYIDQFLAADGKVIVDTDWNFGSGSLQGQNFSLQEFITAFSVNDFGEPIDTSQDYSIIEREGIRYLLIRFNGMDIYAPDDDSFTIYILVEKADGLHATESVSDWARSSSSISKDGIITSGGSSGAGYHISDAKYLDSDGFSHLFYRADECYPGWIGSLFEYYEYHQFSEETIQLAYELDAPECDVECCVTLYTIDNTLYATTNETNSDLTKNFISVTENEGVTWVSEDEINTLYDNSMANHGFTGTEALLWLPIA